MGLFLPGISVDNRSQEKSTAEPQGEDSSWAKVLEGSHGKGEVRWEARARKPARKFWLLLWLTELHPAGAVSSLSGQGCSSDPPSLARTAQPGPAVPTPPETPGAQPGRADTTSGPGTRLSPPRQQRGLVSSLVSSVAPRTPFPGPALPPSSSHRSPSVQ